MKKSKEKLQAAADKAFDAYTKAAKEAFAAFNAYDKADTARSEAYKAHLRADAALDKAGGPLLAQEGKAKE